jgi:hypothetical protein
MVVPVSMRPEIFSFLSSIDFLYGIEDFDGLVESYGRRNFIQYLFQKDRLDTMTLYPQRMKLNLSEVDQLIRIMQNKAELTGIVGILEYRRRLLGLS